MKSALFLSITLAVGATVACVAQTTSTQESGQTVRTSRSATQVVVDDSGATRTYANFCRVTGTAEELIIDFGLNPQPDGTFQDPIVVDQRIILNFYTAKRLASALQMSIERHEQVFGPIETDIDKRIKRNP
jgi:hypothetical protein